MVNRLVCYTEFASGRYEREIKAKVNILYSPIYYVIFLKIKMQGKECLYFLLINNFTTKLIIC